MTEYKKLEMLLEKLKTDTHALTEGLAEDLNEHTGSSPSSRSTIMELHAVGEDIKFAVLQAIPRLQKIVSKAREKNPDRQIYNEMMCGKIEQLFEAFCEVVATRLMPCESECDISSRGKMLQFVREVVLEQREIHLDECPMLAKINGLYNAYMLQRAAAEAWTERIARDISQAIKFEEETRVVIIAQEKQDRAKLIKHNDLERTRIDELLRRKEAQKSEAEKLRRSLEHARLKEASRALDRDSISLLIAEMVKDPRLQKLFAARMLRLTKDLLIRPEEERIRKLRNNNQNLIQDFGHPCLSCEPPHGCCCQSINSLAERIWYALGYEFRYTANQTLTPPSLIVCGMLSDIALPCGRLLHEHQYTNMGFEDYSERFLELNEPDAVKDSNAWMEWYKRVQDIGAALSSLL